MACSAWYSDDVSPCFALSAEYSDDTISAESLCCRSACSFFCNCPSRSTIVPSRISVFLVNASRVSTNFFNFSFFVLKSSIENTPLFLSDSTSAARVTFCCAISSSDSFRCCNARFCSSRSWMVPAISCKVPITFFISSTLSISACKASSSVLWTSLDKSLSKTSSSPLLPSVVLRARSLPVISIDVC